MVGRRYKFYLSFENSNCIDYISEKFWQALKHKVSQKCLAASCKEDCVYQGPPHRHGSKARGLQSTRSSKLFPSCGQLSQSSETCRAPDFPPREHGGVHQTPGLGWPRPFPGHQVLLPGVRPPPPPQARPLPLGHRGVVEPGQDLHQLLLDQLLVN